MDYGLKGKNYFLLGYNCSQSVVLAFQDKLNLPTSTLLSLASSFGGGIGRLREVCGCISAMAIIMGLLYGNYDKDDVSDKAKHYQLIQNLTFQFKDKYGSYICADLLNLKKGPSNPMPGIRNKAYYESRPCGNYIYYMCELIAREIEKHEQT